MRILPLLLFGALLFPQPLAAAGALSPWVNAILDRSEAGALTAASVSGGTCGASGDASALLAEIDEHVQRLLDTSINTTESATFVRERSVCMEHDRRLLLDAMQKTASSALSSAALCHRSAAAASVATLEFLSAAYRSFLEGIDDPTVIDARLRSVHPFESEAQWESGQTEPVIDPLSTAPLCPFTTDYVPHTLAASWTSYAAPIPMIGTQSFGCDLTVLRCIASPLGASVPPQCDPAIPAAADPAIKEEAAIIADSMENIDAVARPLYRALSTARQTLDAIIAALTGGTPSGGPPPAIPEPPHAVLSGCLRPPAPLTSTNDDPSATEDALAAFPAYADASYLSSLGLRPDTDTADPPPHLLLPWWLPLRSPSRSWAEDFLSFAAVRETDGVIRALPKDWSPPDATHPFSPMREEEGDALREASGNIGRVSAVLDAIGRDAFEQGRLASKPLHDAVSSLATVTEEFLPQEYIPSLTYFLLRSCSGGPCEERLKAIAQRSFNPYCHPFLSGKFLEEDVPEKCFCLGAYANEPFCKG